MTDQVGICNRALSAIGTRTTITSITESSAEARLCNIHYDNTRTSLLRVHNWSFARRQVTMALLGSASGTPENPTGSGTLSMDPWLYKYAFPSDCMRVREIFQPIKLATPTPYMISADVDSGNNYIKVICTDQQSAVLVYTTDVANPDLWDQEFADAMVAALAADLAIPLTGDKTIAAEMVKIANQTLLQARTTDFTETPTNKESVPDWIAVRGYSTSTQADLGLINSVLS